MSRQSVPRRRTGNREHLTTVSMDMPASDQLRAKTQRLEFETQTVLTLVSIRLLAAEVTLLTQFSFTHYRAMHNEHRAVLLQ